MAHPGGDAIFGRIVTDVLGRDGTPAPVIPPVAVDDSWFDAGVCRNCGAALATPHCGACGQKAAVRLSTRDMGREGWDRIRLFELKSARTLLRLVTAPGRVARDYVMGRRHAYTNPLALLIALVAILVVMLAANRYFIVAGGGDAMVDRMAARVMAWANWSFSLGIVAIFAGSWSVFRRRLGYNAIEHAVLAVYCQALILAAIVVNMLPTLVWRDPAFVLWHKQASQYYLYAIKLAVVAVAYRQFFLLDLRRDWSRLLMACAIYLAASWALLRLYAAAILWMMT